MISTEIRPAVPSSLVDLRNVPLAEMPVLGTGLLGEAIERVLPESPTPPVPVAAFNSAI
jgi:FXSXX-COOH protein